MKSRLLCLAAAVLLMAACDSPAPENSYELKIGAMSSMDFLPLVVARDEGIFEKHGLKVKIVKFYSANDRDAALQSGNIDGTVTDYTGAVLQKAGGLDVKITSACNARFCVMTGPESGISGLPGLEGRKVAVSRNTVIDFCIEKALESAGLPASAVEKQEINKIPVRFEMLLSGQTDATALPDPFITIAASKGASALACMEDLDYAVTGFVFLSATLRDHPAELKAFYRAYNEAVERITAGAVPGLKAMLVQDMGFPEPLAGNVNLPRYSKAGMPREKDIKAAISWLEGKGLVSPAFDAAGLLDGSFVNP